jgi:hypothetical protein
MVACAHRLGWLRDGLVVASPALAFCLPARRKKCSTRATNNTQTRNNPARPQTHRRPPAAPAPPCHKAPPPPRAAPPASARRRRAPPAGTPPAAAPRRARWRPGRRPRRGSARRAFGRLGWLGGFVGRWVGVSLCSVKQATDSADSLCCHASTITNPPPPSHPRNQSTNRLSLVGLDVHQRRQQLLP